VSGVPPDNEEGDDLRMFDNSRPEQVVILCGGMGTRLREETEFRPKPLVEIGGRPILWHIMKIYSSYGFKRFILCLGYKGHMVKEYFINYQLMNSDFTLRLNEPQRPCLHNDLKSDEEWQITFVETGNEANTGARVKRVERHITGEDFLLTYGDGVGNIDLNKLWNFHQKQGKIGTVTGVRPFSRYGELSIERELVTHFAEKPPLQEGMVSGGFFVFRREFLQYLEDDDRCALEREPLSRLAHEGQLSCYAHTDFWHAMDTYRDFTILNDLWKHSAPWKAWQ
jgi:glucose-1-phosphate cytidylyltransferase